MSQVAMVIEGQIVYVFPTINLVLSHFHVLNTQIFVSVQIFL